MNTIGSKGIKIDDKKLSNIIDATSGRAIAWAEEVRTMGEEAEKRLVVLGVP